MEFIDLFAGLGGFHLALSALGCTCVFASELDAGLRDLYERNFDIMPEGDIRKVASDDIPRHDILCAGFPCQPFSKAGTQQGLKHPQLGDLWGEVIRIADHHRPQYIILENVPNLARHANGETWAKMKTELRELGYDVDHHRLSPHKFGIPQIRERIFIVASKTGLNNFRWPEENRDIEPSIRDILTANPPNAKPLSPQVVECLEVWQEFLDRFPKPEPLPSFPIWSMEFGASYPYAETTPFALKPDALRTYLGSHGKPLKELADHELMLSLPSHARSSQFQFPDWKIDFIRKNRDLYYRHEKWINEWIPKILKFPSSLQKFEWNCKGTERNIWNLVIQFRASGVRVKKPTTSPSLIAMNTTQVPIIGWERRYMTPDEAARLQSMDNLKELPTTQATAFRALGNAVNVALVQRIAAALLEGEGEATHPQIDTPHCIETISEPLIQASAPPHHLNAI